ncbi:hypothetical protein N7G274_002698 [Stereocaulon virgatum]|uniref:FAD-binding FR-type domain-containing protein n=1 Tax=Stereocaulon virgatum TaxID=373712 RepID=A0ABR4AGK2_9LECA
MIHTAPISFHKGEQTIQRLLHVPSQDNPTSPGLSPHATRLLHLSSLIAIGTTDNEGRPWTTLLGGEPGFARSLGQSMIGVKTVVDRKHDPVIDILVGGQKDGEVRDVGKGGRLVSALGIHLATRNRIKLWGRMVAGALGHHGLEAEEKDDGTAEVQLVFAIQQSLGNCPKYLNKKNIVPAKPEPLLLSDSPILCDRALELLEKADMFFISSQYESNMGTNHRGGPQGFVRVEQNDTSGTVIIYPELSGNRLYQTLGNLYTNPRAGLVFPDFDSGDALYVTGTTEIVIGNDAAAVLPRSNVIVKINVVAARLVQRSLAFRGIMGERSPYNPPVRYLTTERAQALPDVQAKNIKAAYANLLARDLLTPTIARFRFRISDPELAGQWKPGQYVALAFEDELSLGYSHMRDDDPKSLNDDYVRTFTVSSASGGSASPGGKLPDDEFEITIRNVGVVTNFMFRQNIRAGLEVPLKGFGGTFTIEQGPDEIVPFVAGGIGITPLLAHLSSLDLGRIRLFWTINIRDINMVFDTFSRYPSLTPSTRVFVSRIDELSPAEREETIRKLDLVGAHVHLRRMLASDVEGHQDLATNWYLCAGAPLRKSLLKWLSGRKVLYEDFNY